MSAEDQTQNQGFSADELELLSLLLAEEGIGPQPSLTIPPRGPAAESPLSFAQQRLWFLYQLEPESTVYNLPTALRIKGRLDVGALRRTLQEIVRRHEALRTTFRMRKGGPVQVVAPALEAELPVVELGRLPEAEREAEAARLAAEEARQPFDLERGPLLRAKLLRLDEESHVALFTMHHIVADGWSVGVLVREVGALYEAFSKGDAPALAELPIQYADYAVWQREYLTGAVLEEQLAYWREQLAGLPTLELPTDRPRPAVQGFRGATQSVALPKPLGDALLELGRREGATPFMTLLAAFKVLLYRYTRQKEIVVGTPVAGRNRLETEGLIGFFVNTLVLRTRLSGATTFRELLARVREVTAGAQAHQDVPFEKLVEEFQPERDPGRHPLFQVVFVYQNAPQQALELPGLSLSSQGGEDETAKFDLTLIVNETPQGLAAALQYNTDLFEPATAAQMLAHFRTLLEGIAADPNRAVASLPLVGERERRELLAGSRGPRADFPGEACLPQLFEAQAARTPDAVAVTFEGQQLSYGELNERANRLAHHLRALGVGPEALVGIMMERSHEVVLAILATLKAGAAYLPLDPSYPAERLRFMLEDSGARVLLTQERLLDSAPDFGGPLLCLDRDADAFGGLPATDPAPSAVAANAAYVIYTSGSTGRPKGVVVTHANVARLFAAAESRFSFGARDVWTLFHSYAFDFSVWELWGALLYGGRLVVVPFVVSRAPEAFRELLLRERVTVLNQTPTAFRQLMRADEEAGGGGGLSLRYVVFGGEALELGSLRPWYERHPESEPLLVNMYGITETTVHVTHRALREADAAPGAGSLIGEPLDDLDLYVLDERMEPAPLGVAGELYVGGAGLARGYLNRPSLTAERFVPDPYGARAGGRLYRTGDVARRRRDGELEYVGRSDEQVKIRGHRIEVGEVEAALAAHGAVREAAVVVSGEGGEKRLVAYATTREEVGAGELRRHLKERLPGYMMPAAVVVVERMPLTENGKLDRARLASAAAEARPEGGDYEGPRTEAEALLAAVWAEVLGVGRVGINDNFFALGGDSIRS
ncbi:MAG TPA: amino acid adenylation domain-containing protein, partial [Pyrinomonadaceae bacterium]